MPSVSKLHRLVLVWAMPLLLAGCVSPDEAARTRPASTTTSNDNDARVHRRATELVQSGEANTFDEARIRAAAELLQSTPPSSGQ